MHCLAYKVPKFVDLETSVLELLCCVVESVMGVRQCFVFDSR